MSFSYVHQETHYFLLQSLLWHLLH